MNTSKYKIVQPSNKVRVFGKDGKVRDIAVNDAMSDADAELLCSKNSRNIMRVHEGAAVVVEIKSDSSKKNFKK